MTTVTVPGQPPLTLPDDLLANLRAVHGPTAVNAWLAGLEARIAGILADLDARIVPGEPPLSYHLVFFAEQSDGTEIVVKCTVPSDEQPPELAAVEALSRAGIGPRLIWTDLDRGALAMDRVVPGEILPTQLPTLAEDAGTTRLLATLADRIARRIDIEPIRDQLVPVETYTQAIETVDAASELWRAHHEAIEHAVRLRAALLTAPDRRDSFVHGDLHHYNVLRDARHKPRVIDPKGLVGPAGYEFGPLTYNPAGIADHPHLRDVLAQRVRIWSEVRAMPWDDVRAWGYVAAVLSAAWSGQGGMVAWQHAIRVATTLRTLQPPRG